MSENPNNRLYQSKIELLHLFLRCPDCCSGELVVTQGADGLICRECGALFPRLHGRPVLLRHDNILFPINAYLNSFVNEISPPVEGAKWLNRLIPSPSVNLSCHKTLDRLKSELSGLEEGLVLVVGGGNQKVWLAKKFELCNRIQLVFSDIDVRSDVDLFCDGHDLPFKDGCFDAVITTAVLEHVLYPERVAAEIHRVLKLGGLLYSEIPFMQQVHEGAYDFTRYTLSGHRRLFNGFSELESGMVAGPATALVWAIENFVLAFARSATIRIAIKTIVRFTFGWLKYFDYLLINRTEAMDGASCTYFLGCKINGQIPDTEIIARYVGAKYLKHV